MADETDYNAYPDRWNGKDALCELSRQGKILKVSITADGVTAERVFTEAEAEEFAAAAAYIYRQIRLED